MWNWLRRLLNEGPPPDGCHLGEADIPSSPSAAVPVEIKVTINVSPIHVFITGPEVPQAAPDATGSNRSLSPDSTSRVTTDSVKALAEGQQLSKLGIKIAAFKVPEVSFGKESTSPSGGPSGRQE